MAITHAMPTAATHAVSGRELLPWAVFAGALFMVLLYLVGFEQSAASVSSGTMLHEFVHDGRHLLGVPCH